MPILRRCKFCGKEIYVFLCKLKIGKGKYCSKRCMGKATRGKNHYKWKPKIRKVCLGCNKEFYVWPSRLKKGGRKFCSKKCYDETQRKGKITHCLTCEKEVYVRPSRRNEGGGKYCSSSCSSRKHWQDSLYRKKMKKLGKQHWKDPEYVKKMYKARAAKPTKPEKELDRILQENFPNEFKYTGDGRDGTTLGGRIPDFLNVNGKKQVIEMFGDYWHSPLLNSKVRWSATYKEKIKHFRKHGYKALIIWEHELENKEIVINKIRNYV